MKNAQIHINRCTNVPEPDLPMTVCSATDCTGLEPHPVFSEEEKSCYENLYPYLPSTDASDSSGTP